MKKILILLLFIPAFLNAQLSSVNDIATYSNPTITTLHISDPVRGGTFFLYTGSDTADNGMIFLDFNNNKWLRQTSDNKINTAWYGMRSYIVGNSNAANDSYSAFMKAVNYIYSHKQFNTLYIPYDSTGLKSYFFLSTIILDKDINIVGDGTFNNPTTALLFNGNTRCFYLPSTNGAHIQLQNLIIRQATPVGGYDSTAHGIESRTFINIKNVTVKNVSGNGVHIAACASVNSPIFGNADFSILENLQTFECNNGLYIEGCDANVIAINTSSFVNNRRWGVYDDGFLGNLYRDCHFATNGKSGYSIVTFNGNYYVSKDSSYNVGKRPDLNPEYWQLITPMGGANAWDTATRYYSGGVAIIKNINSFSKFDHCYTESFQPPVILNNRTSYEGGTMGATVIGGIVLRVLNGIFFSYGSDGNGTQVDKLGVGQAPSTHTLSLTGKNYQLMKLTSPTELAEIRLANSGDDYGGVAYSNDDLLFTSSNNYRIRFNRDGLAPYTQDAVLNLGSPTRRFDSVHAVKYYGDGSALTGIQGGSGISQQTLNDTAAAIRSAIPTVPATVNRVWLPDNVINNSGVANTLADVTGLTFPVVAGSRYAFKVVIVYNSAATTTGSRWVINGPAATDMSYRSQYPTNATAITNNTSLAGYNLPAGCNASSLTANNRCEIWGEILPSANGDVQVRFASEISASAITAIGGRSYLEYQIIN